MCVYMMDPPTIALGYGGAYDRGRTGCVAGFAALVDRSRPLRGRCAA